MHQAHSIVEHGAARAGLKRAPANDRLPTGSISWVNPILSASDTVREFASRRRPDRNVRCLTAILACLVPAGCGSEKTNVPDEVVPTVTFDPPPELPGGPPL